MTTSGRRRRNDDFESWAGHGVPIEGTDDVEIVIAPGLEARLRRFVAAMDGLDDADRTELVSELEKMLLSVFRRRRDDMDRAQRARIDALLRKAGLPPLG